MEDDYLIVKTYKGQKNIMDIFGIIMLIKQ